MDAYEATKIVFSRIQSLDPENAAKIMGLLLIQDHGEKEMIRLAFGPQSLLQSLVFRAHKDLGFLAVSSPADELFDFSGEPFKPCLYFARGYCKNGSSCRFSHEETAAMSFWLQNQQRVASLMVGREDANKFVVGGRQKIERSDFSGIGSPVSRQIYLTFPADSTFREEDVSNYFSVYGPVQDVRIPYQQKRMFGFVTFLYSDTVKLILAKGNPHFVCESRVLVKPYKEKGKIPDKNRRGDFSIDSRDTFDLQQIGARMLYSRRMEEQRELQQAIEIQQRRFMGLQLLDLKRNSMNSSMLEGDKSLMLGVVAARVEKEELSPKKEGDFQERAEHNLPDSPFASPTKLAFAAAAAAADYSSFFSPPDSGSGIASSSTSSSLFASNLLPTTSTLEHMTPFKSCFFQMPRFSSGHGAVGL